MAASCTYVIPPTNYHLIATQQEPYKGAYLLTQNVQRTAEKMAEWTVGRKIRQKEQED